MIITYSECESVVLVIQHAMRMRPIVICGLPRFTIFFHIISERHDFRKQNLLNIKFVFEFIYNVCLKCFSFKEELNET